MQVLWGLILTALGTAYGQQTIDIKSWKAVVALWERLGTEYRWLRIIEQQRLISDLSSTLTKEQRWPLSESCQKYYDSVIDPQANNYESVIRTYISSIDADALDADVTYQAERTKLEEVISEVNSKQEFYLKNLLLFIRAYNDEMNGETIQHIIVHDLRFNIAFLETASKFLNFIHERNPDESTSNDLKDELTAYITILNGKLDQLKQSATHPTGIAFKLTTFLPTKNDHITAVQSLITWLNGVKEAYKGVEDFDTYTTRVNAVEEILKDTSHFMESLNSVYPMPTGNAWFIMDVNSRSILSDACYKIIATFKNGTETLDNIKESAAESEALVSSVSELETAISEYRTSIATVLETVPIDGLVRAAQEAEFAKLVNQFNAFVVKFNEIFGPMNATEVEHDAYVEQVHNINAMKWDVELYKNVMDAIFSIVRLRGLDFDKDPTNVMKKDYAAIFDKVTVLHRLFLDYYNDGDLDVSEKLFTMSKIEGIIFEAVENALKDLSAFDKDLRASNAPPAEHQSRAPELLELMLKLAVPIDATHNKEGDNTSLGRAPSTRSNLNNAGDGFILSSVLLTTTSVLLMV
ncbi:hypothetical protein X943_003211 [Babesia divergens]|uniref:Uncharacterized protein n=1 Tax=Babesia divergens TaxID=32595 RepID=A0AAD9GKY6_BABDI|nr:hypothetical protein X943_003211 [Babesia divergens]